MNGQFRLTETEVRKVAERYGTPVLVLSLAQIEANYRFLKERLPRVNLYYAMKSNPDERIIRTLERLGGCFDVASDGEIMALAQMGVAPERIVYANPVKTKQGLAAARRTGVNRFTFDSESEIDKMAKEAPGGSVLLRVRVVNPDALVDLNLKFGARPDEAIDLLTKAKAAGLDVAGLCFHVGSQSTTPDAYLTALKACREIFDQAAALGMPLRTLDIGGGFPIPTLEHEVDVDGIAATLRAALDELFPDTELWAEPGRFICGTAQNLITSVIGCQIRNGQEWYFLDDGLYGSFSGVIFDHWDFELVTFKDDAELYPATIAGPSCDSLDVLFKDRMLPKLAMDDLIYVPNCGAYTSASATTFNGFAKTQILAWEEIKDSL
ncbi:type III PLP-dependent enzyme [Azotosporobacter soli]|uniref:type III PLP-dependent enzyme n=1 Tax=Azotosporobacter soli TaxID=3055040 RepID=UPI0031FEBF51